MCATCGCNGDHDHHHHHDHDHDHHHEHDHPHAAAPRVVRFERELLAKNDRIAAETRRMLAARRIALFNVIGSPGAGKTALLEALIPRLLLTGPVTVLEGDQATDRDARRIEAAGCRAVQITTGTGCHLDASMIASALPAIAPPPESIVFVENVGNLVCPALFDLGEGAKIVVMSVTEGEDKPLKYPHVFRAARLVVLTKTDLQPLVALDEARTFAYAFAMNPRLQTMRVSARDGEGIDKLCRWIREDARSRWLEPSTSVTAR